MDILDMFLERHDVMRTRQVPMLLDQFSVERAGPEHISQAIHNAHSAFENFYERVQQIVAEGDMVACRVEFGGKHRGDYVGVPPAGKEARWAGYRIMRIQGGKVAEMWWLGDNYGLLKPLGVITQ